MDGESTPLSAGVDHPALPGHFPGQPIVPGVVILDLLVEECRRHHPEITLHGLRKMKFVRMLEPAESFTVSWGEIRDGRLGFTARVGDKSLATGQFVVG